MVIHLLVFYIPLLITFNGSWTKKLNTLPIGCDDIGLPLDQVLGLLARDVGHGGKGVAEVCSGTLYAVSEEEHLKQNDAKIIRQSCSHNHFINDSKYSFQSLNGTLKSTCFFSSSNWSTLKCPVNISGTVRILPRLFQNQTSFNSTGFELFKGTLFLFQKSPLWYLW